MEGEKKSRYKYSQSEKDTLRVLKMQEQDLASLEGNTVSQTNELDEIRKRVESLSAKLGVTPIPKAKAEDVPIRPFNIPKTEIPSWED